VAAVYQPFRRQETLPRRGPDKGLKDLTPEFVLGAGPFGDHPALRATTDLNGKKIDYARESFSSENGGGALLGPRDYTTALLAMVVEEAHNLNYWMVYEKDAKQQQTLRRACQLLRITYTPLEYNHATRPPKKLGDFDLMTTLAAARGHNSMKAYVEDSASFKGKVTTSNPDGNCDSSRAAASFATLMDLQLGPPPGTLPALVFSPPSWVDLATKIHSLEVCSKGLQAIKYQLALKPANNDLAKIKANWTSTTTRMSRMVLAEEAFVGLGREEEHRAVAKERAEEGL
jgi:hypothetical protein